MVKDDVDAGAVFNRTIELLLSQPKATLVYVAVLAMLGLGLDLAGNDSSVIFNIASTAAGLLLSRHILAKVGYNVGTSPRFGAYIGLGILAGLATIVGFVLLIVPGVILFVRWLPAYGILLTEDAGVTEALGTSWQRTAASFWPLLAVTVLYGVAIVAVLGGAFLLASNPDLPIWLWSVPMNLGIAVASAFAVCLGLAAHILLDPHAPQGLEQVFA